MITVSGAVNAPGNYPFFKEVSVRSIIRNAGGLSPSAEKTNIFVTYADGLSKKYHPIFRNHKIKDGSKVFVGFKIEEEPFNKTEYARDLTSIIASFAQAISMIIIAK